MNKVIITDVCGEIKCFIYPNLKSQKKDSEIGSNGRIHCGFVCHIKKLPLCCTLCESPKDLCAQKAKSYDSFELLVKRINLEEKANKKLEESKKDNK
jgi:hypothetical protein